MMSDSLKPFIYWGQSKDRIYLKVDLSEITVGPDVNIDEDHLEFKAHGTGAHGRNLYGFKLDFYLPIDAKKSKYNLTGRAVEFECHKVGVGEIWPRLTSSNQKLVWLRPDFDRFAFDESDRSDNDEFEMNDKEMMKELDKEFKASQVNTLYDLRTYYLFVYNMFQWIGYTYAFLWLALRYFRYGIDSYKDAFETVGPILMICQFAGVLEIIHPLLGWVKTGFIMPLIQVGGRSMILFGLLLGEPQLQTKEPVWWLFLTWSAIELIRYPYYMLNVIDREISFITWLRYTAWIPLYPAGFVLEGIIMLLALPTFDKSNKWSIGLPNTLNISFHFPTFLRVYMIAFFAGMYMLMQRMHEQRKKKLKTSSTKPKSRKQA